MLAPQLCSTVRRRVSLHPWSSGPARGVHCWATTASPLCPTVPSGSAVPRRRTQLNMNVWPETCLDQCWSGSLLLYEVSWIKMYSPSFPPFKNKQSSKLTKWLKTCCAFICFPVHGGYSEWAEWGPCSVSCGVGSQKRLRQCNNPLPANGGRHCAGSDTETRSCQGKPCPGESALKNQRQRIQPALSACKGHSVQMAHVGTKSVPSVPLQWMVTGQSGLSGRSVLVPVVRATEPGSGPAVTLQLSMEAGLVRGRQWRSSCAVSDLVQVSNQICFL